MADVTQILSRIEQGDHGAAEQLLPLIYQELRRLAASRLADEKPGNTLQATALVHEAYLRLVKTEENWRSRAHFFGAAAEAMRRILVEQARRKAAAKHGGGRKRQSIENLEIAVPARDLDMLAIHEALDRFEKVDPQAACLVKLRYFSGFTVPEAATALGIGTTTGDRYWAYARAWLHSELKDSQD